MVTIRLKFEGGRTGEYYVHEKVVDAHVDKIHKALNSEGNGKNKIKLDKNLTLINTKLIGYEIINN